MDQIRNEAGGRYVVILPRMTKRQANQSWPVIFINGDEELLDFMKEEALLPLTHAVAVMALSSCRQDDFTPWPGPPLNSRFPAFGGKADAWLAWLMRHVLPAVREEYPVSSKRSETGLLGQSLGGMAALYAQMTDCSKAFGRIAAISPSCWYPGFLDRFQAGLKHIPDTAYYVSCGEAEGAKSVDIKREMVRNNRRLIEFLTEIQGKERVVSHWDDGGHRDYLEERYRRAFNWLQQDRSQSGLHR